jgi:hypothetical protein
VPFISPMDPSAPIYRSAISDLEVRALEAVNPGYFASVVAVIDLTP